MRVVSFSLYATLYVLPFTFAFATPVHEKIVTAVVTTTICPISAARSGSTRTAYTVVSDTPTSTKTTIESTEPERSQGPHATSPSRQVSSTTADTATSSTYWATVTVFNILEKNGTISDRLSEATTNVACLNRGHNSTLATLASHSFGNFSRADTGSHGMFSGTSGHNRPTSLSTLPFPTSNFVSSGVSLLKPWYFVLMMACASTL
ncbi:hypothetical protein IF2G_10812 [Cordyceps javanica]|nr:hypothetical protein IF2G_10812 [Cordyceps javanica]